MIETFDSLPLQLTFTGTWERSTVTPYSGTHCLKSGNIGDGMTSSAFLTVDLPKGGTVQFRFRVSTENGYDKFYFSIDNIQYISALSGNIPWTLSQVYTLAPGTHTLRWLYTKDGSAAVGEDSVYIDDLDIVPNYDVNITVDTKRSVANSVTFLADTKRQIGAIAEVDTKREVIASVNTATDTLRQIKASVNIAPDTTRTVTHRSLFVADTERIIPKFAIVNTDTSRTVLGAVTFSADTLRRMTTHLRDTKVVTVTLAAKTLSDSFDIQTYQAVEIGQVITGTIKGLAYTFIADEVSFDERSKLYSVRGTYDIDQKLNDIISNPAAATSASAVMQYVCTAIGKTLSFTADDFDPPDVFLYGDTGDAKITDTYSGIVGKLYGWTDRVPTLGVNVFERGSVIHVLQRGKESSVITLDPAQCSYPTITRKKMQLLKPGADDNDIYGAEPEDGNWINGTFGGSTFVNGLLIKEEFENVKYLEDEPFVPWLVTSSVTNYVYSANKPPAKLLSQTAVTRPSELTESTAMLAMRKYTYYDSIATTTTAHSYQDDNLIQTVETTKTEKITKIVTYFNNTPTTQILEGETTKSLTITNYTKAGQGMWIVTTYQDGSLVSSSVSTGNPGSDASVYSIQRDSKENDNRATAKINGRLLSDNSFPVIDQAAVNRIASAINDLHGKIEERVSLTYYGASLVDFTSRVAFRGAEYYLERNAISETPRGTSQQLELVRWA